MSEAPELRLEARSNPIVRFGAEANPARARRPASLPQQSVARSAYACLFLDNTMARVLGLSNGHGAGPRLQERLSRRAGATGTLGACAVPRS